MAYYDHTVANSVAFGGGQVSHIALAATSWTHAILGRQIAGSGVYNSLWHALAIAVFCEKLTSTGTSVVQDLESIRSAHDSPVEIPPAGRGSAKSWPGGELAACDTPM